MTSLVLRDLILEPLTPNVNAPLVLHVAWVKKGTLKATFPKWYQW
jgi:hypothetical protein